MKKLEVETKSETTSRLVCLQSIVLFLIVLESVLCNY